MSVAEGERARDAAIAEVRTGMNMDWYAAALQAIRALAARYARTGERFTTDDVWEALEARLVNTPEHRAMGAVMRDAARAGTIAPTANYQKSRRPACHARPVRVWVGL